MKCSKCCKEKPILYTKVDMTTGKSAAICTDCEVARMPESLTLNEADATIEELLDLKRRMEQLVGSIGDVQPASATTGIPNFGIGPLELLANIDAFLKNATQDRANILAATSDPIIPQEPPASGEDRP